MYKVEKLSKSHESLHHLGIAYCIAVVCKVFEPNKFLFLI